MTLLSLRSLALPRGAIAPLTRDFAPGVHLIVGPNGIGKTSLLNAIAGTLPVISGEILIDGKAASAESAKVVLAPNVPPDVPWIRAGLLLEFVASLYPATRREAAYSAEVLTKLGIDRVLDAPLGTLSAGTARKVLLAAALTAAPPVMLFDEPTNEVDAASIAAFRELIAEASGTRAVLITTHHASDLNSLGASVLDVTPRAG